MSPLQVDTNTRVSDSCNNWWCCFCCKDQVQEPAIRPHALVRSVAMRTLADTEVLQTTTEIDFHAVHINVKVTPGVTPEQSLHEEQ